MPPCKESWLPLHARKNQPVLSLCGELDDLQEYQSGSVERCASPCASVTIKGCDHLSIADRNYFKKYTMQKRLCDTPVPDQHNKLFPAVHAGLEALRVLAQGEDSLQSVVKPEEIEVLDSCGDKRLLQCWIGSKCPTTTDAGAVMAG
eukprot:TRINITY_DN72815_c0_g1_i1.p2 TRINITY_DN72815_c0_g1~~TRINITY_DN72815_c0_g1_i1.p2  ORF type:complete len:147 (+),score=9.64 TRINITY_DN72815_c0_g1_i1:124-564(+)